MAWGGSRTLRRGRRVRGSPQGVSGGVEVPFKGQAAVLRSLLKCLRLRSKLKRRLAYPTGGICYNGQRRDQISFIAPRAFQRSLLVDDHLKLRA